MVLAGSPVARLVERSGAEFCDLGKVWFAVPVYANNANHRVDDGLSYLWLCG